MASIAETNPVTHLSQQELQRPPESPLTLQHAGLIFFHSYDHAQGAPPIQTQIFNFIHLMRPYWRIDNNFRDSQLRPLALEKISKYLNHAKNHMPIPDTKDITIDLDDRLRDFQNACNLSDGDASRRIEATVLSISKGIIHRDFKFLIEDYGRLYRKDPWFSYACHYGLLGNTTNIPEFDIMYKMVNKFIRTPGQMSQMRDTDAKLDIVINTFLEKHPDIPSVW